MHIDKAYIALSYNISMRAPKQTVTLAHWKKDIQILLELKATLYLLTNRKFREQYLLQTTQVTSTF